MSDAASEKEILILRAHVAALEELLSVHQQTVLEQSESLKHEHHLLAHAKTEAERQAASLEREVLERRETERRLSLQNALTRSLAETSTLKDAASGFLWAIGEYMKAETCHVWEIDVNGSTLRHVAGWSQRAGLRDCSKNIKPDLANHVLQFKDLVWIIPSNSENKIYTTTVCASRCRGLAFPIVQYAMILGVIEVRFNDSIRFDESLVPLLKDFGSQIGQFLKREIAERERRNLELQLIQASKLESIGQLAAGIAHEINTPTQFIGDNVRFIKDAFIELAPLLSAYSLFVSNVRHGRTDEMDIEAVTAAESAVDLDYITKEIPLAIEQSLDGVRRVSEIVSAMKDFTHPGTEVKVNTDINRAISTTLIVARNTWKYVADVKTEFGPEVFQVPLLPGAFNQVILNLIVNAAHAVGEAIEGTNRKGMITISTKRNGEYVEIRIADTGIGIPKHIQPRIFEPFFTTKGVGKGTGQGLAISRAIICKRHGGTIHFESEENVGTVFVIRLPVNDLGPQGASSNAMPAVL